MPDAGVPVAGGIGANALIPSRGPQSSIGWALVIATVALMVAGFYYGFPPEAFIAFGGVMVGIVFIFFDESYGLLALAVFAHFLDAITLFDRSRGGGSAIAIYTIVAAAAIIVYGWGEKGKQATLFVGLSIASFLGPALVIPAIKGILSRVFAVAPAVYLDGLLVFAPIWVIYLIFNDQRLRQAGSLYVTLWLVIFSVNFMYVSQTSGLGDISRLGFTPELINVYKPVQELYRQTITSAKAVWQKLLGSFRMVQTSVGEGFDSQIQEAIYGTQERPKAFVGLDIMGVSILEGDRVIAGEPVTLSSDIKAGVLDQEIAVAFACEAKPDDQDKSIIKADSVLPKESVTIYSEWLEPVDCLFEDISPGEYELSMAAEYGFTTKGEFSNYAIGIDLWNALIARARKEGGNAKDIFFSQQNLPALGQSVSTAGPVLVSIDSGRELLTIDENNPTDIILKATVSVSPGWQGKIKDLDAITIVVPNGFDVRDVAGRDPKVPVEQLTCSELPQSRQVLGACDDAKHSVFVAKLRDESMGLVRNVRIYLSPANPQEILRSGVYSINTFKVIADYTFSVERAARLSVREQ